MKKPKEHIGDGVYAEADEWGVWLTTENGLGVTNRVYLDPYVYAALVRYLEAPKAMEQKTSE